MIFDSQVPISSGQAVYMSALADQVANAELDRCLEIYSRRTVAHGVRPWTRADVPPPAKRRFYRAVASAHFVVDQHGQGIPGVAGREGGVASRPSARIGWAERALQWS